MSLRIRAGAVAREILRREGWSWDQFDIVVGASGGPKWLVLSALDRVLADVLSHRKGPVHLLGSSSGAWRFLAYCQPDPIGSLANLEEAYIEANWNKKQTPAALTAAAKGILDAYARPVLADNSFRLHVITALCRGPAAFESAPLQFLGLLSAALLGWLGRPWMGLLVARQLFSDRRAPLPASFDDLPTLHRRLDHDNVMPAVLASGAIPLVLPAVRTLGGCLRDGGLVDYHFDHLCLQPKGLILFPHFSPGLLRGWLGRRGAHAKVIERMVLLHPAPEWIAKLPGGALPNRQDALRFSETERKRRWHEAALRSHDLADALKTGDPGMWRGQITPLEGT